MSTTNITFCPINDKQKAFFESTKRFLLLSGAVGAGKSYIGCWNGVKLNLLYPGNRGLICRKEGVSLKYSTVVTLLEKVIPKEMIVSYNKSEGVLTHKTPVPGVYSTICFSGLDKSADSSYPTKIGSTEYGWIFADETIEFSEEDWEVLSSRLRYKISYTNYLLIKKGHRGKYPTYHEYCNKMIRQMFGATNPDSPKHYLYKLFFENKSDDYEVFLTTPYDNPTLDKDYMRSLETSLKGIRRERLLLGKWVQAEGAIYPMFSHQTNVIDIDFVKEIGRYKYFFGGADSNFPIPRAGAIFGVTSEGQIHLLDDFYQESSPVESLAQWFSEFASRYRCTVNVFHDPSDPEAIEKINRYPGLTCQKGLNAVLPGISQVSLYLENGILKINSKCINSITYLTNYKWKKGGEEQPEKKDDHLPDAIRYALFTYANSQKISANYMMPQFM